MDEPMATLAIRRELYERFPVAPVAYSADGRSVAFAGPLQLGLGVGDLAIVERSAALRLVIQVHDVSIVDGPGAELEVAGDGLGERIESVRASLRIRAVRGEGVLLGRLSADGYEPMVSAGAFGEAIVRPPTEVELVTVVDAIDGGADTIEIGTWRQAPGVPARIRSKGFARHTFMCGQSGSGKTYTTGVLFERLLASTTLPIVVLDPNSDHVNLGAVDDESDSSAQAEHYRRVGSSVRVARARGHDADFTLCADFSELSLDFQAVLLRLHPVRDLDAYATLRRVTSAMTSAPYSVAEVADAARSDPLSAPLAARIDNLGIADWMVWRRDGETSIAGANLRSHRCVVLDLGSLPHPDERTAVALVLLAARWAHRHERQPSLLAIDEAHNVLPATTDDPLLAATTDLGVLIAGEGRKFGLHLFIASQRPSKVHPNVLSQCDNLLLMRMNGQADIDDLVTTFSHVPAPMLRQATTFTLGQALFAGPIAPVPVLAQVGSRLTAEGGGDVPTTWTRPPAPQEL